MVYAAVVAMSLWLVTYAVVVIGNHDDFMRILSVYLGWFSALVSVYPLRWSSAMGIVPCPLRWSSAMGIVFYFLEVPSTLGSVAYGGI